MRLLVITQTIDERDTQLGFFVEWVRELSQRYEVEVICLKKGTHTLSDSVRVHSLGKESADTRTLITRARYIFRFYRAALATMRRTDAVFVHMNQEYVLLMGLLWKLWGVRVFLWRNHYAGSPLTDLAARLCDKVFFTSRFSYTARYKHAVQMPVGIDTHLFSMGDTREPRSIVSLGRIAPSKRVHVLLEALKQLHRDTIQYMAHIYGTALPEDEDYLRGLRAAQAEYGLTQEVVFHDGIAHADVARVLRSMSIFVNMSRSGMLDKTIFEAAACGCLVLARSEDYHAAVDERLRLTDDSPEELAKKLRALLVLEETEARTMRAGLRDMVVRDHGLPALMKRLHAEMS